MVLVAYKSLWIRYLFLINMTPFDNKNLFFVA